MVYLVFRKINWYLVFSLRSVYLAFVKICRLPFVTERACGGGGGGHRSGGTIGTNWCTFPSPPPPEIDATRDWINITNYESGI